MQKQEKRREGRVLQEGEEQVQAWELREGESGKSEGHRDRKWAQEEHWIVNTNR